MKELPKRRHTKDSVQIIKIMLDIKQPATIEEIAKQVQLHYNPNPKDSDFWHTFGEKLFMAVNCGYIRKDKGYYSLVYPLPTVEEIIHETRNRTQLKLNEIVYPPPTVQEIIADTWKRNLPSKLNRIVVRNSQKVAQKKPSIKRSQSIG